MKKLSLLAILVALSVSAAFAGPVDFGAHVGGNFSTWTGDADDAPWGLGFNAGLAAKLDLGIIALVPEAVIELRRLHDEETEMGKTFETTASQWLINIPVMARFTPVPFFFVAAGPSFGISLSNKLEECFEGQSRSIDLNKAEGFDVNPVEVGWVFAVGTSILPMLDIDFRYAMGITNIMESDYEYGPSMSVENMQFALGVTYWF